jgi:microcompartment protein CcmL/EutN
MTILSLGLIETRGLVAAIEAADAAAKAAQITLLSAELLGGGIVTLRLQGELGAVQAAVEAGAQAAKRIGEVVAVRVIPRPVPELRTLSPSTKFTVAPGSRPSIDTSHTHDKKQVEPNDASIEPHREFKPAPARMKVPRSAPISTAKPSESPREAVTIQRPSELSSITPHLQHSSPATTSRPHHNYAALEAMPVVRLRQYARSVKNLGIQGRQISMANKTQLLEAIRQASAQSSSA